MRSEGGSSYEVITKHAAAKKFLGCMLLWLLIAMWMNDLLAFIGQNFGLLSKTER